MTDDNRTPDPLTDNDSRRGSSEGTPVYQIGGGGSQPTSRLHFLKGELRVRHGSRDEADAMIRRHYLGKWPAITRCILVFGNPPIGVVVFADAPRETSVRYGDLTWELARLWVDDSMPTNVESWALAQARRHIRTDHPVVGCVVSYADPSAGHAGTIYRAAGWTSDGRTDEGRKSPRCDYVEVASGKRVSRRSHAKGQVVRVPRVSKWRFTARLREADHAD